MCKLAAIVLAAAMCVDAQANDMPVEAFKMFAHDSQTYIYSTLTGDVYWIMRQDGSPSMIMRIPIMPDSVVNTLTWFKHLQDLKNKK